MRRMPKRFAPVRLKTVRVIDSEIVGLKSEQVAARTPFVLTTREGSLKPVPVDRAGSSFLGWLRLYVGLKSTSAQRRQGLWLHREDWVWPAQQLIEARHGMALHASRGYLVAIAEVWAPIQRVEQAQLSKTGKTTVIVRKVGPPELPALQDLQWLVQSSELNESKLTLETLESYLHVRQYVRMSGGRSAGERGWRQMVL